MSGPRLLLTQHTTATSTIDAPVDVVWPLIAEFRRWPEWGPSIRDVDTDAHQVAPGVTGRVLTIVGLWLPFEVTSVEPRRSWHWRVAGIPATGHLVTPIGESKTRVAFTVPRLLTPYRIVLRAALRRVATLAEAA